MNTIKWSTPKMFDKKLDQEVFYYTSNIYVEAADHNLGEMDKPWNPGIQIRIPTEFKNKKLPNSYFLNYVETHLDECKKIAIDEIDSTEQFLIEEGILSYTIASKIKRLANDLKYEYNLSTTS